MIIKHERAETSTFEGKSDAASVCCTADQERLNNVAVVTEQILQRQKQRDQRSPARAASGMGEGTREGAHRRGPRHLALRVGNKGRERNKGRKGWHSSSLTFHIDLQRIKGWNVEGNVLSQRECLSDLRRQDPLNRVRRVHIFRRTSWHMLWWSSCPETLEKRQGE